MQLVYTCGHWYSKKKNWMKCKSRGKMYAFCKGIMHTSYMPKKQARCFPYMFALGQMHLQLQSKHVNAEYYQDLISIQV